MLRTRRHLLRLPLLALFVACRPRIVGEVDNSLVQSPPQSATAAATTSAQTSATASATPTPGAGSTPTEGARAIPSATSTVVEAAGEKSKVEIVVDQVGYGSTAPKVATIYLADTSGRPVPRRFQVMPTAGGTPLVTGETTGPVAEPETGGHQAWLADFSSLRADGTFRIHVEGSDDSPPFVVSRSVYADVYAKAARSYLLNRCGVAVDDPTTGVKHAACHLSAGVLEDNQGTTIDVSGGWHDAGDYGRYMPTAAVTVGQMLLLAELVPGAAKSSLSGTDLLAEARYELDWMLKMQRADGGMYHKVTTANFPGWIRPEDDGARLLVYGVGTADTGAAAAAFARAARVFAADRAYAQKLADSALRAWRWLQDHPQHVIPPVGATGPYLSGDDRDTREWAAAELYALTGESTYEVFLEAWPRSWVGPVSWADTGDLALITHALTPSAKAQVRDHAVQIIVNQASERASAAASHPFGVALRPDEYTWASAKNALAIAQHLLVANKLAPDPSFAAAAANQLHWVLGRNPLGRSLVTGVGARPPLHPHHRIVASGGKMIPGMLVGGPNARAEDGRAPANLGPRSYVDDQEAYSCNEPAIDYNAPLVFVSGWLAFAES